MPTVSTTGFAPPRAAVSFALWGSALVDGRTSLDEAAAVIGGGRPHRLSGVPGEADPVSLTVALARLRTAGAHAFGVALPVPGDPLGLSGPRSYTEAAVAAGQAVLVPHLRLALVPALAPPEPIAAVHWEVWPDLPAAPNSDSISAAARGLRETVLAAAETLASLDAPVTPGSESEIPRPPLMTPSGLDPRALDLLHRADVLLTAVQTALADPAVSGSARLDTRRRDALVPVERAARRAIVAACHSPMAELRRP